MQTVIEFDFTVNQQDHGRETQKKLLHFFKK